MWQGARGGGGSALTLCPLPWHPLLSLSLPSQRGGHRADPAAGRATQVGGDSPGADLWPCGGRGSQPCSPSQIPGVPPGQPPDGSSPQFILKHEKYQHLREVERFPNSFNPHIPDTLALLKSILSQVIEKHRRSTWIHIGADEVGRGSAGTPTLTPGTGGAPRTAEHLSSPKSRFFISGRGWTPRTG